MSAIWAKLPLMRLFAARLLLLLAIVFLMHACASKNEVMTSYSSPQTEGAVAGEKVSDDVQLTPGTGTRPNANVHW
jgi:hypothetical protein